MAESKGRFVWYELMTTDVEGAKAFYGEVVGWRTRPAPGAVDYTLFCIGEDGVAGLMQQPDQVKKMGAPPMWLGYLGTDNVERTAKQVVALGGKQLLAAQDIPEVGRFAVVADPQGAVFALFQPQPKPDAVRPEDELRAGEVAWHELYTTDYASAWTFYSKLAGWHHTGSFEMGPEVVTYWMFESAPGERTRGGISNVAKAHKFPPYWSFYFEVPDIAAAAQGVKSLGGTILNGPVEVPGGDNILQGRDPQGANFALYMKQT